MGIRHFAAGAVVLAATFGMTAAQAVCVENGTTLFNALVQWSSSDSGTVTTIKVARGIYSINLNLGQGNDDDGGELQLLGGYQPGTNCSTAGRIVDPTNTVLDGGNGNFDVYINGPVTFDGLTLRHYSGVDGIHLYGYTDDAKITWRRFIAQDDTTIELNTPADIRVENCLVYGNATHIGQASLQVENGGQGVVTHCTIADSGGDGLNLQTYNDGQLFVYNTIVWGSAGHDLITAAGNSNVPLLLFSTYQTKNATVLETGTSTGNPKFVSEGGHDYHLESTALPISPAINTATTGVFGGMPSTDIQGSARPQGSAPDRGAYESPYDDRNDFVVTSSADTSHGSDPVVNCNTNSTSCTLREAIIRSNAASGASKIRFQLSGCPAVIQLGSPLPDISSTVTIDGNTQPGWTPNTDPNGFNANLCMLINGAGLRAYALHVPSSASSSARLIAQGLIFTGFSDAAIKLEGGSNHAIHGSQFGGVAFTLNNHDSIRVTGGAGSTFIGGYDDPAASNLIVGSTNIGVYLDNSAGKNIVANNFIGLTADGQSSLGNATGVFIYNSPHNTLQYNYVSNSSSYGVGIAGISATANVLQYNHIGLNTSGLNAGNAAAGVYLAAGSANNTIGAPAGASYGGNRIAYSGSQGVWLTTTSGVGNRIVGNAIYDNAGLAIDLGASGPTANDAFDGDSGANGLLNYPIVLNAFRTANAEYVEGILDAFNDSGAGFRIDFYFSPVCGALGSPPRGDAAQYLGTTTAYADLFGHAVYSVTLPAPTNASALGYVSATVTATDGSTSEIGDCKAESTDLIFRNGFEVH
ncbi:MAG: right-handed parallel beta-helix repeat-containing protein [Dokdonella sp.]